MARTDYSKVRYNELEKKQFEEVAKYYDLSIAEMVRLLVSKEYEKLKMLRELD